MRRSMRNRRRNLELLARKVPSDLTSQEGIRLVARQMWKAIDTPVSLGLYLREKYGLLEEIVKTEFCPNNYLDYQAAAAGDDYQAISFLRKFPLTIEGVDRASASRKKFLEAEEQCRTTNIRIRSMRVRGYSSPRVAAIMSMAARKISHWLGSLDAKSWALRCRFGPGADALNKGTRISSYHKLSRTSTTLDFIDGAQALVLSHPVWARFLSGQKGIDESRDPPDSTAVLNSIAIVPGNRVIFVPKTALVDRAIAIEPGLNIFAQLGLGALIRSRLKRAGLDLDTQLPNQELARQGSRNGTVATIDLSAASDTISTELVRDLLPDQWFLALDWCRSKRGTITTDSGEQHQIRYEKFSSMGNGYTFELESMIFFALSLSVAEYCNIQDPKSVVRSYGDDITVPPVCVELLEEVFSFCGFSVNVKKSFSSGVFRESCGADFFNGVNIRPYFLKEFCDSAPSLFRLANGIRRTAYRRNLGFGCDSKLRPVWLHVVRRIPDSLRDLRIPYRPTLTSWPDIESGDGGLAVSHDEALSSPYVRFNTEYMAGWLFAELQASPSVRRASTEDWDNFYLFALYASRDGTATEQLTLDRITGRGGAGRRLTLEAFAPSWMNLGPWI